MVTLVQLGCKEIFSLLGHVLVYCYDIMFLKQYHSGLEKVIHIVLAP